MYTITTQPSSAIWRDDDGWHGHITIYANEDGSAQVQLERCFERETQASRWRTSMVEMLRESHIGMRVPSA